MILSPWFSRVLSGALFWGAIGSSFGAAASSSPQPAGEKIDYDHVKQFLVFSPRPSYPYEARKVRAGGSGVAMLKIDEETGRVQEATMRASTGSVVLDNNTLLTLRLWRFQPHTVAKATVAINYSMQGVSIEKHERSMAEILTPFLGETALRKAPTPQYPEYVNWGHRQGKGVYVISDDARGQVTSVTVRKSSGDPVFDEAVQKTLRKWQFTRGPLTVELPFSFVLTPTSYRIDVAR